MPASAENSEEEASSASQFGFLLAHLVVFLAMRFLVFEVGVIDESHYYSASTLPALGLNLLSTLPGLAIILLVLKVAWKDNESWRSVKHGTYLRCFALLVASSLAFTFAGQGVNLYFGQEYLLDRVCLLALASLVAYRPVFIVLYLLVFIAYAGQFSSPIEGYGWDIHLLGIHRIQISVLLAIFCAFLLKPHFERFSVLHASLFLSLIVVASFYWVPGVGKLRIGWLYTTSAHLSLFGAWSHGWLAAWPADRVLYWTDQMKPFAYFLQVVVCLAECGAVFVLARRLSLILLPIWVLFHAGVGITYGFSFLSWMLIDLALLAFVWFRPNAARFTWTEWALGVVLIGLSPFWLNPNRLAWFNAPLTNTFHVVATTADGDEFDVPPSAFSPYQYIFTMQLFSKLSDVPLVVGPYGATTSGRTAARTGAELARVQERGKPVAQNEQFKEQITSLLRNYASQWNSGEDNRSMLAWLQLPQTLNTTLPRRDMTRHEIVALRLERRLAYIDKQQIKREVKQVCLEIDDIP